MTEPVKDGWGHVLADDSTPALLRELDGMLSNDKHEQLMDKFYEENKPDRPEKSQKNCEKE